MEPGPSPREAAAPAADQPSTSAEQLSKAAEPGPSAAAASASETSTAGACPSQQSQSQAPPGPGQAHSGGGDMSATAEAGAAEASGTLAEAGAGWTAEAQQDPQAAEARAAAEAEALSRAEALKREGNECFGRGAWVEAAAKYNEALDTAPASAAKERAIYFCNLAACNIKVEEYAAAVQNCTTALDLDPSYGKARMRRAEAFERLDELDHALQDAKALLEADPESAWARGKVAALQPRVEERTEKLKAEMLGKLKDLGNTILGKFGLSTDNFKFDKDPNTGSYNIKFER